VERNDMNSKASWYDDMYKKHKTGEKACGISVNNMVKARSLVKQIWKSFNLRPMRGETSVLDLGCGLGFVSEALREAGGNVTGIDMSSVAIESARTAFPLVAYECASFEEIIRGQRKFDIIWALDFSVLNTDDMEAIGNDFIRPCLDIMNDDGILIIGWHTNLTGQRIDNWVHWDNALIRKLKENFRLLGPRIVKFKSELLNGMILYGYRFIVRYGISSLVKSIPLYLLLRKSSNDLYAYT
jgi:SAM-dependent methyltransferase